MLTFSPLTPLGITLTLWRDKTIFLPSFFIGPGHPPREWSYKKTYERLKKELARKKERQYLRAWFLTSPETCKDLEDQKGYIMVHPPEGLEFRQLKGPHLWLDKTDFHPGLILAYPEATLNGVRLSGLIILKLTR